MKILSVTGYKPMEMNIFSEKDERIPFIQYALRQRLIDFLEEGLEWVLISGQMGVELWAAEVVLGLQEDYDVKLGVFPPFEDFTSRWPEAMQEKFEAVRFQADFYRPLYKGGYRGPFQFRARDEWFLDKCDASLILMDHDFPGSTVYYHRVAEQKRGHEVFYLTPLDLQDAVEALQMEEDNW